ncbi:MAG: bi-domain-containing oxidoreductase [Rhodospirillales bacterium]
MTMKQLVQTMKTGELRLEDAPVPTPEDRFALVRTTASVVSAGTERMLVEMGEKSLLGKAMARPDLVRKVIDKARREGIRKTMQTVEARLSGPSPLGYSAAGVVEQAGSLVPGLRPGDRVACAGAGFANHAEFNVVPGNLLARIPDNVSDEEAAFSTLGSIALQGQRLADPKLGEVFLVIGLGLLGQLAAQLLQANGCRVIGFDPADIMVRRAEEIGVKASTDTEAVRSLCLDETSGHGVDGVLICAATASNDPVTLAGEVTRENGRVVAVGAVGTGLPRDPYFRKEIAFHISRSYGPGRYDADYEIGGMDYPYGYVRFTEQRNMVAFLDLISAGRIDVKRLITHRFAFADALDAYSLIKGERKEPYLGILLTYSGKTIAGPAVQSSPAVVSSDKVGLSVIGAGAYATGVLLPAFQKQGGFEFRAVATGAGRAAPTVAQKFGFAEGAVAADRVMSGSSDVIAILTRHDSHAALAAEALAAGKHVYIEKPLAMDRDGLVKVHKAWKAAGDRQVMVGFNRRFSPLVQEVQSFLKPVAGPRTIMIRINAGAIPRDHWTQDPERGGGRIIGEACHFVDLSQALADSEVTAISAISHGGTAIPAQLADDVSLSLTMANGSIATIIYTASGPNAVDKEYIEVFAGGRAAVIRDFREGSLFGTTGRAKKIGGGGQDKGQTAMIAAFAAGLKSGAPALTAGSAMLTTLATFSAIAAIGSGKTQPVSLSDLDDGN